MMARFFPFSGFLFFAALSLADALRVPVVAGNWKMNPSTLAEAEELASAIHSSATVEVVLFPPTPFLPHVRAALPVGVNMGAQDVCVLADQGAFTSGVSLPMLSSTSCGYVLAGHSERRSVFGETNEEVAGKLRATLNAGLLRVVLCVGESREEFDQKITNDVCRLQLRKALFGVSAHEMPRLILAYEPVWAIGTGLTCDPETAQEVHRSLRKELGEIFEGTSVAEDTRILYGGSVTPATVDALMSQPDVDGVLVGGASLNAEAFNRIVAFK